MRIGNKEKAEQPDGISMGGSFFSIMKNWGLINREQIADPNSKSYLITHKTQPFCLSFPRRRESRGLVRNWIPAYAGMTMQTTFYDIINY
ncbi:MAG TPA: hypothetical protein EYG88_07480 [Desulfocapsa sulfexigens]|nr:hypothetical protein [Desulfocapsa sulfexigens]